MTIYDWTSDLFSETNNRYIGYISGVTVVAICGGYIHDRFNFYDPHNIRNYKVLSLGIASGLASSGALMFTDRFNDPPFTGSLITVGSVLIFCNCAYRGVEGRLNENNRTEFIMEAIRYLGLGFHLSAFLSQFETRICTLATVGLVLATFTDLYRCFDSNAFGFYNYIGTGVLISACWRGLN